MDAALSSETLIMRSNVFDFTGLRDTESEDADQRSSPMRSSIGEYLKVRRKWLCIGVFLNCVGSLVAALGGCGGRGAAAPAAPAAPILSSIAVTPADVSVVETTMQQFRATGTYSDNTTQDLTTTVRWTSSAINVATINNAGLASSVGLGTTTIRAASGSIGDSTLLAVTASLFSPLIQHVVVIFQENRTPDNLFHGFPGADIANSGTNSAGQTISLTPTSLATNYDLGHNHVNFLEMYDGGKMDGADKINVSCVRKASDCPPANAQFRYVNPEEVQPYFQLAEQYTFGDRMFQSNQGPSFPAHQFIISGTSAPTATSNLFAAENPVVPRGAAPTGEGAGCNAPMGTLVNMIDPFGAESSKLYPCFEHPTLTDSLDSQAIDWRYYAPVAASLSIWVAPDAIRHIRFGGDWNRVILNPTQVLTDIANGHLAQVSWVVPSGQASDHADINDGSGPSWVASVVNAVGNSSYWAHTAIIITWDDWGGWYDHVPPPSILNSYEYGFRVPLIVVSPYAKRGYVSHVTHNFGSILKFIEEVFKLPSLGYADARSDDLLDCFDLTQGPSSFTPIAATFSAQDFLNDKRPPLPPDDDDQ
jgi:phospholipase C